MSQLVPKKKLTATFERQNIIASTIWALLNVTTSHLGKRILDIVSLITNVAHMYFVSDVVDYGLT